jgi:NAD(P)H-dependent nitrite reductase small subunit
MTDWIRITTTENIPLREGRAVKVGRQEVAIFNLGDRFAAIDNACPHSGGPLCDGMVTGTAVVCPLHGWKVSLEDGSILRPNVPACAELYPVKVEDGVIHIQLPEVEDKQKGIAA